MPPSDWYPTPPPETVTQRLDRKDRERRERERKDRERKDRERKDRERKDRERKDREREDRERRGRKRDDDEKSSGAFSDIGTIPFSDSGRTYSVPPKSSEYLKNVKETSVGKNYEEERPPEEFLKPSRNGRGRDDRDSRAGTTRRRESCSPSRRRHQERPIDEERRGTLYHLDKQRRKKIEKVEAPDDDYDIPKPKSLRPRSDYSESISASSQNSKRSSRHSSRYTDSITSSSASTIKAGRDEQCMVPYDYGVEGGYPSRHRSPTPTRYRRPEPPREKMAYSARGPEYDMTESEAQMAAIAASQSKHGSSQYSGAPSTTSGYSHQSIRSRAPTDSKYSHRSGHSGAVGSYNGYPPPPTGYPPPPTGYPPPPSGYMEPRPSAVVKSANASYPNGSRTYQSIEVVGAANINIVNEFRNLNLGGGYR